MNLKTSFQYLFLVFVFLLPLQTAYLLREPFVNGVKWEYGIVGAYATDILLLFIIILSVIPGLTRNLGGWISGSRVPPEAGKQFGMTNLCLALFVLWTGLSILWAGDQGLASYFFVKLLLVGGLFLVVKSWEKLDFKKVVFVLIAAGVLQSGIGIAQFLSQQSIDSSILGMSAHEASQAGSSVLKIDSGRFLRAYGTFPHPNVLGGFLVVILVFCISYYVFCITCKKDTVPLSVIPTESASGGISKDLDPSALLGMTIERLILLAGSIIIFLGLILTFSRSAWLGVGIAILAYYVFCIRYQVWEIQMRFFKVLAALGLASLVFGFLLHDQIFPRFDRATIEWEGSVTERIVSLQDARRIIAEHPLIGIGAGNFTAEIIEKGEMGAKGEMGSRPVWSIQPAHNVFVLVLSELGIVGLVLFILFLGSVIWQFYKGPSFSRLIFSIAILTLIPSLFLDHWLWSSHFGLLFFFLLLGFTSRR